MVFGEAVCEVMGSPAVGPWEREVDECFGTTLPRMKSWRAAGFSFNSFTEHVLCFAGRFHPARRNSHRVSMLTVILQVPAMPVCVRVISSQWSVHLK